MLTENQIQRVARLVRLAPYMTVEQREGLLKLVRELQAADAAGVMPQSAIQDLVNAVGDAQVRDIVNDLKGGRAQPGWLPPSPARPEERRGPPKEVPLEGRRDIRWIDQMCDVQDRIDKAERIKGFGSAGLGGPKVLTKEDK
jgi:hypothetical protein